MKQEKRRHHSPPQGDIPASLTGYRIEISAEGRGARILIGGVRRILRAEESCVQLRAGQKTLSFYGRGLSCLALEGGILEIRGEMLELSLGTGRDE